ncbi:dihydrofolate reductase [Chitinophaga niastensis]|uniref:Dihydrofolate reductase n=1 Tax=Chitinophaga niastensis TaxID=536980 RepID=A0A2P8HGV4_CHINA|nr:dihydrofolate reductase family protein [Chitinophaga niastensis]PSL45443.1 dihydrofolate reductase [Chitinophaga niastensis]
MRKLIYAINLTIDGCFDHTKVIGDEAMLEYWTHVLREADLLVYGRITYQLMVPYWPDVAKNHSMAKAENDFADTFDSLDKVVFSRSLERAEDKKTRIVRTDLQDEILKLKQQEGRDILLGGVALPSQLIALGLVDEFLFVIHPVIAGEGKRLMEGIDLQERLQLRLVESKILKSGCVALRYLKQ